MDHFSQYSPFISVSDSTQQPLSKAGHQRDGLLDYLGKSTVGELYWNGKMDSLGLVCGSSDTEMATIVQRLMASHMKDPESQVLILHTDHVSISRGPCSLLDSMAARPLVLVSPHFVAGVVEKYTSQGLRVLPIISKETSITLRHVLALFTPPAGMKGASSILCTIQLILSQLGEPFDLQRFIELIDQEKWSEDGVDFIALRQTLLMKLLSPEIDVHQYGPQQMLLVDLTDSILWRTGLDSSIMDIALYDFIQSSGGRKLVVLNNCQRYLTQNSNLTKSLEAIATLGNDRPTGIIFSTTDPTVVSTSLLNLVDYVIIGSTRSLQWSNSLRQHFAGIDVSKGRLRGGRAMIWSPESTSLVQNTLGAASQQLWKDDPAFIDIEQLKQSTPVTQTEGSLAGIHNHDCIPNGAEQKANKSPVTRQEVIAVETSRECERTGEEDEERVVSLGRLDNLSMNGHPSSPGPVASSNEEHPVSLLTQQTSAVASRPITTDLSDIAARFTPLISIISMLGDGKPGTLVDYKAVKTGMKSRKQEIKRLGWRSAKLGPILTAACQEGVLESIEINRCIKFLTLLPIPLDSETYAAHSAAPNNEDKVLIGENTTHVAASHPEPLMVTPGSDTPSKVRRAGAPPADPKNDSLPRPTDHYPDKYVPLIAAVLKLSDGRTDHKVTLEALRGELRGVLVSEIMRANAWLTIEQWINQACLEHYLQQGCLELMQGRMDRRVWVMVPATNDGGALFEDALSPIAVPVLAPDTVPYETEQSTLTRVGVHTLRRFGDDLTSLWPKMKALSTTVPSQQPGQIETPSALGQTQTIARLEPLIACISRLCSRRPYSEVPYTIVKQEMNSRKAEIESLGWPNFGMLMEAACKENVIEPITRKRNGTIKFLRLIPQSLGPLPLPQVVPTEYSTAPTKPVITRKELATAMDYPIEHRPVVLTMLRLMSVTPEAGVPMTELAKTLGRDYPCREGDYYLISQAEQDGILSMGEYSGSWAYLNSPPTHTAPSPISPPTPPWIPSQNPPLQLTSRMAGTSHYAFEHPLITSAILELTGGAWDIKVRLVDLIASLLRSCSGAEGMVLPLLFHAKQGGLTMDETDAAGAIWVWLRSPPHTGSTAPLNQALSPPQEPAYPIPFPMPNTSLLGQDIVSGVHRPPIPEDYPLAHREVVATILKLTRGIVGERIPVANLASSLAHDFPRSQGPWYLIFQAQERGILKQETDATGATWVYLKHSSTPVVVPPPSETATLLTSSTHHVPQSEPIQPPTRISSGQSTTMEATASTSASQAPAKKFIVDIIPYGETRHAANGMNVEENCPRKSKPSGAEAQEPDLQISPKAVEKEVDSRIRQDRHRRRSSLGMLTDAAVELTLVEPGVPPPSTPPHAPQSMPAQIPTDMGDDPPVPTSLPPPAPSLSFPVSAKKITTTSCPPKHRAVVAALITLTDGTPGKRVRMDDWMSSLRGEYPGGREEFLLSLIAKAEEDGVVTRGRSQDGVQWAWLNPKKVI